MKIRAEIEQSWYIVFLQGTLTIRNLSFIRKYFEQAELAQVRGVVIDMSGVTQLDSSGITLLVNFQRRIVQKKEVLVIAGLQSDIAEIFSIVGIDTVFKICTTLEEFRSVYFK